VPKYQAITKTDFANLRWKRYESYHFAALDALAPLVVQELPKACMTLPIAFIQQGEAFVPAAVQGLQPGQNLFVSPDGRWIGPYKNKKDNNKKDTHFNCQINSIL